MLNRRSFSETFIKGQAMCRSKIASVIALFGFGMGAAQPASAEFWLQAGESLVEQGDFLLHPGLQLAIGMADGSRYRLDFTGRRYGSFVEASTILGVDQSIALFPWPALTALYGVSVLDEYTAYHPPSAKSQDEHSLNLGLNLGLNLRVWEGDRWHVNAEWDAHLFAAGFAFLLLTTARKSIFTLGVGMLL